MSPKVPNGTFVTGTKVPNKEVSMNFFKKNQIVVFTIGLMLITAGYLSYMNNNKEDTKTSIDASSIADSEEMASIGDAKLVSANVAQSVNEMTNNTDKNINNTDLDSSINEIVDTETSAITDTKDENTLETSSNNSNSIDEYFTSSRLDRETMYSQRIENYQDILNNSNVSEAQKKTAQEEITKLNNEQNALMITENLLKTKDIEDLIIFVNGDSINVIVKGNDIRKEEIAQIQNIITRELNADIGNIHITTKE